MNESNPINIFTIWFNEAKNFIIDIPEAFALATSSDKGEPSVRMLLLKYYDENGFVFFTNYNSLKGKQIEKNPYGSMLFFWKELKRQIRINGKIKKISRSESEKYFNTRPEGSKISSWASHQSSIIPDRQYIINRFNEFSQRFKNKEIPCPEYWGGYILEPFYFEFWEERKNRLHERVCYKLEDNIWKKFYLAP